MDNSTPQLASSGRGECTLALAGRLLRTNRGASIAEVLGALVLTALVLGGLLMLMNQMNSSALAIKTKESILQESRDLMNHIVQSVRRGFEASSDPAYPLLLQEGNNGAQYIRYSYDSNTASVLVETYLQREGSNSPEKIIHTLATHVESFIVAISENNTKVDIKLTLRLPNGQTVEQSTVAYTL